MLSSWLNKMSISRRLILIVTSINIIVLLLISLIAISSNQRTLETQATRRFSEKNQQIANAMSAELDDVIETAISIRDELSGLTAYSQAQMRSSIQDLIRQDDDVLIHRVSVYRPHTNINGESIDDSVVVFQISSPATGVIDETRTFTFDNQQPAPDAGMFKPLESNQAGWFKQEVAYEDREGSGAVSLALPYAYADTSTGVIWIDIPQPIFDDLFLTQLNNVGLLSETMNGFAMLIDENGELLSVSGERAHDITTDLAGEILSRLDSNRRVDYLYSINDPTTEQVDLVATDNLRATNWQIASVLPRADVPQPSGILAIQLGMIAIAGILALIIAITHFTDRAIIKPVMNLSRAAQEIGSGDMRYYIDYRDMEDEIGFLARAMDGMKSNIDHSYEELRAWSRMLEARVVERTKQLDDTRQEAESIANDLRAVYDESLTVVNEPELEPILDAFAHRILSLMSASYCAVWLLNDDKDKVRLVTNTHQPQTREFLLDANEGLVGQAMTQEAVIVIDDYTSYPYRVELPYDDKVPYVRAMCAPLMFDGSPLGAVVVGRGETGTPFTETETRLLTLFSNLVSPAVRNAQLYDQREEARASAERANMVKTRFLASVTHELRTPLNLIINNMDFMRVGAFGDINDEQLSRLNQTVRSAEHLLYLINDLLDVSKIDAGEMQLFFQPSDVHTIIEDCVDSTYAFMEKLEDKADKVQLVLDVDEDLPRIPIDSRRIRQVLTNLLSNAVKFTPEGDVTLTVKKQEDHLFFAVKDTGIGIPPEEFAVLFEAFERTTQAKEQNIEGTGLGLPISQFLVQQHGGEIEVESSVGEGTTFSFSLPLARENFVKDDDSQSSTTMLKSNN